MNEVDPNFREQLGNIIKQMQEVFEEVFTIQSSQGQEDNAAESQAKDPATTLSSPTTAPTSTPQQCRAATSTSPPVPLNENASGNRDASGQMKDATLSQEVKKCIADAVKQQLDQFNESLQNKVEQLIKEGFKRQQDQFNEFLQNEREIRDEHQEEQQLGYFKKCDICGRDGLIGNRGLNGHKARFCDKSKRP